jgi:hypothetical protein
MTKITILLARLLYSTVYGLGWYREGYVMTNLRLRDSSLFRIPSHIMTVTALENCLCNKINEFSKCKHQKKRMKRKV